MSTSELKQFIKSAPEKPGIYIFKDTTGKPLYIGKAVNIRLRLSNYPRVTDSRIQEMLRQSNSVSFQIADSEVEALIFESQLIKKLKPKFNIVMRDDKQYSFVIFSEDEFPKIYTGHQPGNLDAIGPFTDAGALKTTLRILRRLFPYCTCKQKHHVRCLNAHIGKCLGFCCLKQPTINNLQLTIYKKNIKAIKEILSGKKHALTKQLEKEMKLLGKSGQLQEARELQKKIVRVSRVFENATIIARNGGQNSAIALQELAQLLNITAHRIEGYDVANIQGDFATGSMVVFTNGLPDKNEYRKFNIKTVTGSNDVAMLKEVLTRRFKHAPPAGGWPLPDLIIVDGGIPQMNIVKKIAKKIPVIALTKDEYHRGHHIYTSAKKGAVRLDKIPQEARNLILAIDSEAHRFAISQYRKLHRRSLNK